jgi:plastocyanin
MSRRTPLLFLLLLTLFALIAAGCGGDDDEGASSDTAPTETSGGSAGGGNLALAADPGGAPKFDPAALEAPAGTVVIDFTNDSSNPHNVTIEGNGIEEVASDTVTGDSTSVSADLEAGTYTFYCSVDGHRAAGMEGTLTVK